MRRRSRWMCALVGLAALLASMGPASSAVPTKCPKGKIVRVTNGKKACVAAKAYRQRVTKLTPGASALRRTLTGYPVKLRQKNGRVVADVIRPRLVAATESAYAAAEAELTPAVRAAMGQTASARATADGPPSITRNADGSVSGSITKTVAVDGQAVTMKLGLTGHPNPAGEGTIDIEVGLAVDDGAGTTTGRSFRLKDIISKPRKPCPTATGAAQVDGRWEGGTTASTKFGSERVHLGTVRQGQTVAVKSTGQAQIGPDGTSKPFPLTVTASFDYSRNADVLGFFQSRTRAVASGTLTGTMDPATGLLTGATITTNVRTSGFEGTTAAADKAFRDVLEKMLNDEAGRSLKALKEIEANVRKGLCGNRYLIKLVVFTDATFATHNASGSLRATLTATGIKTGNAPPTVFDGTTTASYRDVTFTSKIPPCTYAVEPTIPGNIIFNLSITPAGLLHVTWEGSATLDAKAAVQCPDSAPIGGQPGPSLIAPSPMEFDLPIDGGTQAVDGGFTDGGDGWVHSGQITIERQRPE